MDWLSSHSAALGVIVNAAMLVVWIVYLNIFLVSYLRQRRQCILITQGAGSGLSARCFVSNLGLEPIFVVDVLITLSGADLRHTINVTDRTQLTDRELENPREATNQGPMRTGDHSSIGDFATLIDRAMAGAPDKLELDMVETVEVTVVAATAARGSVVGARRIFALETDDGARLLRARAVMAEQIGGRAGRRALRRDLEDRLRVDQPRG
ncbi:hypothetical protein [Limimaricola cinnabarinus]|uniref:hypothetical protein n=1 Tax=Limimaricola cinnabarinus TaxID=1125964 RepID=UPI002FE0803E